MLFFNRHHQQNSFWQARIKPPRIKPEIACTKRKGFYLFVFWDVAHWFQANVEDHPPASPFLALRVFAGPPGPNREDLLFAIGLHEDGAIAYGGHLFGNAVFTDDSDSDSGMSIDVKPEGDLIDVDKDDEDDDNDVKILYESITIDWLQGIRTWIAHFQDLNPPRNTSKIQVFAIAMIKRKVFLNSNRLFQTFHVSHCNKY